MPDKEINIQSETQADEKETAHIEVKVEPVVEPASEKPQENDLPEGCVKAY